MQSEKPEESRPHGAQISDESDAPETETDARLPSISPPDLDGAEPDDIAVGGAPVAGPNGVPSPATHAANTGDSAGHKDPPIEPPGPEDLFQRPRQPLEVHDAHKADAHVEEIPRVRPYVAPASVAPPPQTEPPRASSHAPSAPLATPEKTAAPKQPPGLLDMAESEELISEVDSGDDGRFVLTNLRLIYQGRTAEGAIFSATGVRDVTAIEFGRRPRDARSAWWGVIGLLASIAVWQVTTNETVGAIAGAVVAGISLLLLADYWFRPAGLILRFGTPGGTVEGPVSGKRVREAEALAARVQQLKHSNRFGSSSRPPGGSPRLH